MWRSWLIPSTKTKIGSGTEKRLRKDFSISDDVDLSQRPVATLGVQEGQPVLGTADPDESRNRFFDELDRLLERSSGSVRALSFAPLEELRALHGNYLWFDLRSYKVRWEGNDVTEASEPHARRFIQIEMSEVKIAGDPEETQISNGDCLGKAPLILDPVQMSFDDTRAKASIAAGDDVWFLPPVREQDQADRAGSYFSMQRLRFRTLMRRIVGLETTQPEEPVTVLAWRLVDDPALRDLLIEGGGLRVEGAEGEPTRIALEVSGADEIARTRSAIVLGGLVHTPSWVHGLIGELRKDIHAIVPGGVVRPSRSDSHVDWSVASADMAAAVTAEEGVWHRLAALEKRVRARDEQQASLLREHVLRLSSPGDRYNHSEALRLFSANFWRRPWAASPKSSDAWLSATVDLLNTDPFGAKATPEEWAEQFRHAVTRGASGLKVSYAGNPSDEDLLHWRLLYPLGAVINARTLYLDRDDRSRLDSRLVLA